MGLTASCYKDEVMLGQRNHAYWTNPLDECDETRNVISRIGSGIDVDLRLAIHQSVSVFLR